MIYTHTTLYTQNVNMQEAGALPVRERRRRRRRMQVKTLILLAKV
jgi:hypothetical protein